MFDKKKALEKSLSEDRVHLNLNSNKIIMNPKVQFYFSKEIKWKGEMELLRVITLSCDLKEVLKWGVPCYTFEDNNVVLIHGFKNYCALLFVKGVLLKDPKGILIQQTEHVQAHRQIRFTNLQEIIDQQEDIISYIVEAIELEKNGEKIPFKKPEEFKMVEEFKIRLEENIELKVAFESLTPGRQRAYLLHFGGAKQSLTRAARVDKCIPNILKGIGLNDAYK